MNYSTSKKLLAVYVTTVTVLMSSSLIGCSTGHKYESTGQYLDGTVITTKVKTKLLNDPYVNGLPITVKTYKNVVQLSGFVNNKMQEDRAVELAASVEGVNEVRDSLIIKNR